MDNTVFVQVEESERIAKILGWERNDMNRQAIYRAVLLVLGVLMLAACAGLQGPVVSHGGPLQTYVDLVDQLRAKGMTVEPVDTVSQPFFSVMGQHIKVDGEDVQVFEFPDLGGAEAAVNTLNPDGSEFNSSGHATSVSWIAPPHFYHNARLIVLYVGTNNAVEKTLTDILAPQFAGR